MCRKRCSRLAQSGIRAASSASSGEHVPILPHTAVPPQGAEHFYTWIQLNSSPHATHFDTLGAEGGEEVKVWGGGGVGCAVRQSRDNWERGSGRMGQGWGILEFPVSCIDFLHSEKKMQLHVPSQPFQASVVCRSEGVVVRFVPCGDQHSHSLC